ncbi:hypothetical protein [Flavobacterium sp.]|jgi:hypothetical protein|uniref:hypothetical protein n=1 Tax=Flavobacterium sp. TaxID=239 RepID=UPI0037C0FE17
MEFANKFLVIVLGSVLITGCSKSNPDVPSSMFFETSPILKISTNGEEENFLNTINTNNIQLFYKKDGVLTLLTYGGDYPQGFGVFQEPPLNEKLIKIGCYIGTNQNHEETYIKWNETDMDTLSYDIIRYSTGSIGINSLKFNSVPISINNEYGIYNITKN